MNGGPIILWHGSRGWSGSPKVRPGRKGKVVHGPGLYLTTSFLTARRYARGGGRVLRIELDPDLTWLEDAVIPLAETLAFVGRLRGNHAKKSRAAGGLTLGAERLALRLGGNAVPAFYLRNLLVNDDLATGENGPAIATFFVSHGIHASLVVADGAEGDEDWVVLYDTSKILSCQAVAAGRELPPELPLVRARRQR